VVSAIIKNVVKQLSTLPECGQKRRIAFAQNSCNAESEGFRPHFDLSQ